MMFREAHVGNFEDANIELRLSTFCNRFFSNTEYIFRLYITMPV